MIFLIARTKNKNGIFYKITSDKNHFFEKFDISHPVDYSSAYKLENEECFQITSFSETEYYKNSDVSEKVIVNFSTPDYNQISTDEYNNISFLCSTCGDVFLFQRYVPSQILRTKWFYLSDSPKIQNNPIITLSKYAHAIYSKNEDTLYFKDLTRIKPIFPDLNELYREATQDEVDEFTRVDFIKLSGNYSSKEVGLDNRKRIPQALEKIKKLQSHEKDIIVDYIKEYYPNIPVLEEGRKTFFKISSEDQLKNIIFGIEERYYTTLVSEEKRVANSVKKI